MSGTVRPAPDLANRVAALAASAERISGSVALPDLAPPFATITFLRGSLVAIAVTLVAGLLGALYSVPAIAPFMQAVGIDLRQLRPIHTAFALAWIFLAAAAVVYRFLEDQRGPVTTGDRWRLRVQVVAWGAAGVGIIGTLLFRVTSGREYVGFHPGFSALIVVGWICYLWNFFRVVGRSFWRQPIYVTMWGVGFLFFLVTFLEQHAYLLPGIFADPVHDLRIQWKATGTMVGSFNLFVYGTIYYVGEKISGDSSYCHSRTAYALFGVGLLNSFANFGHHTYHLPQSAVVNWIAFLVSMTEIVILTRAVRDLWCVVRERDDRPFSAARSSFAAAKWWTVAILFSSVVISVPFLNSVIHGTYVVTGHAMGATIGIDTMILLGAVCWILDRYVSSGFGVAAGIEIDTATMRRALVGLNVSVALLVGWLHLAGLVTGVTRMGFAPGETYIPPAWLGASSGVMFAVTGGAAIVFFALVLQVLFPIAFSGFRLASARRLY